MADTRRRAAYILTPVTFGGAEKVSLNFLRAVDRERFDIRPILLVRPWEQETHFAQEISRLGYRYDVIPVARGKSLDPLRVPRVARQLSAVLKQGAFDLVHTHGYFADITGLPIAGRLGIKKLSTCHGYIASSHKMKFYNCLDKHAIKLCQKVIVVSEQLQYDLINSGVNQSRIELIPNAVSVPVWGTTQERARIERRSALGIYPKDFVVGFTGRLSEEKGVRYLIEAVAKLRLEDVPVKLLIVGEGEEKQALQDLVSQRGLGASVVFAGFQADVENWVTVFDVLVLPSLTEGTPLALLESMALGVPVIASAVGGVPKVVTDGMNGLLVEPENVHEISVKIRLLMRDPGLTHKIISNGIRTITEHYNVENWCKRIEHLYAEV